MPPIDKTTSFKPKAPTAARRKPKATASAAKTPAPAKKQAEADLFALTIDAANGRVVSLERVDSTGARHDLSAEDKAGLAKTQAGATFKLLVEQAFEAGIECVLGEDGDKEPAESKADSELSRLLLRSLVEHSRARHLIKSEVLDRAIVRTLIGHAATSESATAH